MVGLSCHALIATPLEEVVKSKKRPDDDMLKMAEIIGNLSLPHFRIFLCLPVIRRIVSTA